ncbi:SLC13 family permease [Arthrobacter sp. 35W]|uniref:SLC13 family permease n=1 Tax=Arthrobacter sp. 35W TaxID=1132441 RepID=UPI00047C9F24
MQGLAVPLVLFAAGAAALATGLLPWGEFVELAARTVPILLFVLAMTIVTELAEAAGLFRAITGWLSAAGAGGSRRGGRTTRADDGGRVGGAGGGVRRGRVAVLWLFVVLLATVSTIFLSLDATAVLVTPVVVLLALHARIPPLPFALTTVWLANTASLLLPVSNLTNLLAQHQLQTTPAQFAALLWAPALVGILVPMALLGTAFRKDLGGRYRPPSSPPASDRVLLAIAGTTVALLLPALVSGIPVAIPSGIAAVFLLAVFAVRRRSALRWSMVPARPLLLTIGLFMVVQALHSHGLAALLGTVAGTGNGYAALLQLAGLGTLSANAINNLPAYLALEPVAGSPLRLAALLIGVNLGPIITPWASLATLLWHERLKALGVDVSWGGYALAGLGAVVVLLPLSVLALWLSAGAS